MGLKEKRKSKGYSQAEISNQLGIPLRTYKRYEQSLDSSSYKYKLLEEKINLLTKKSKPKELKRRNIAIIGAGNVGYPLGLLLAEKNKVVFVDINKDIRNNFKEDVLKYKDYKSLPVSTNLKIFTEKKYLNNVDITIICLPTDYSDTLNGLKTSTIEEYIKYIDLNNPGSLVVIKSTVPIGFTSKMNEITKHTEIVYAPEFLRQDFAVEDYLFPSRIIFGVYKKNLKNKLLASIFESITLNNTKTMFMSYEEAESVKLFSNAYLAMRISYFNELDSYAMKRGFNASNIIKGISADNRIGDYYNNPSFGFGGYCLPKDTQQLSNILGEESKLISSIFESNYNREKMMLFKIIERIYNAKQIDENCSIGIIDFETKNSPIEFIKDGLRKYGYEFFVFDNKSSLKEFIEKHDLLIANRMNDELKQYKEKVITRDIY